MTDAQRLADFIAEQLERDDVPAPLAKLVCVQVVKGNRLGDELRTITIPQPSDPDGVERIAAKLVKLGTEDAEQLGGTVQRYAVQAVFGTEEKARARFVFTCAGGEMDADAITTEGADAEGLTAQAMRHTEFFAQLAASGRRDQVKELQQENATLRKENADLRAEQLRSLRIVRELYLADADLETKRRRANAVNGAIERSLDRFSTFIPHAVNYFSRQKWGKDIFPDAAQGMAAAKLFVDSLRDGDIDKIAAAVGPEKAAELVRFATSISQMPDAGQAAASAAAAAAAELGGPYAARTTELDGQKLLAASNGVRQ